MTDIKPYLQKMLERFADPKVQAAFKGFNKTLQLNFTDTNENWLIRIAEGKPPCLTEEAINEPDILVSISTDALRGIMDKKINPTTAYMQRKIKVTGPIQDLMRLQKLIW